MKNKLNDIEYANKHLKDHVAIAYMYAYHAYPGENGIEWIFFVRSW